MAGSGFFLLAQTSGPGPDTASAPATLTPAATNAATNGALTTMPAVPDVPDRFIEVKEVPPPPPPQTSFWDVSKWDGSTWAMVILVTLVGLMIIIWGVVRFWLVSTRPPKLKDVHTPTLDRMNTNALEHLSDETPPVEDIEPPADLLAAVPDEEPKEPPKDGGEPPKKGE